MPRPSAAPPIDTRQVLKTYNLSSTHPQKWQDSTNSTAAPRSRGKGKPRKQNRYSVLQDQRLDYDESLSGRPDGVEDEEDPLGIYGGVFRSVFLIPFPWNPLEFPLSCHIVPLLFCVTALHVLPSPYLPFPRLIIAFSAKRGFQSTLPLLSLHRTFSPRAPSIHSPSSQQSTPPPPPTLCPRVSKTYKNPFNRNQEHWNNLSQETLIGLYGARMGLMKFTRGWLKAGLLNNKDLGQRGLKSLWTVPIPVPKDSIFCVFILYFLYLFVFRVSGFMSLFLGG